MNANLFSISKPKDKSDVHYEEELILTDTTVIIEKGELLAGIVDKKSIGNSEGGIIHILMNESGPESARLFLSHNQRLVNYWLLNRGFSVGIGDTVVNTKTMKEVDESISSSKNKVENIIHTAQTKGYNKQPGQTIEEVCSLLYSYFSSMSNH